MNEVRSAPAPRPNRAAPSQRADEADGGQIVSDQVFSDQIYSVEVCSVEFCSVEVFSAMDPPTTEHLLRQLRRLDGVERVEPFHVFGDLRGSVFQCRPAADVRMLVFPEACGDELRAHLAAGDLPIPGGQPLLFASDGPCLAPLAFDIGAVDYVDLGEGPDDAPGAAPETLRRALYRAVAQRRTVGRGLDEVLGDLLPRTRFARGSGRSSRTGRNRTLVCRRHRTVHLVPFERIRWIESERNYARVHTDDGALRKRGSLRQLESELPSFFRRVHRSAVVNLRRVARFEPTEDAGHRAVLDDGTEILVSRRRARTLPV